jgi:uncharacterized membrane protein
MAHAETEERGRAVLRWALALVYLGFGGLHLSAPGPFLPIMPGWVPFPREVILFTGACEVAGGAGLLIPRTRRLAGIMLAIYAVCVFPANLHHALDHAHVPALPDSWWYHRPRLAFQPVFVWWGLYAGGAIDWPFSPRHSRAPPRRTREPSRWAGEAGCSGQARA